eukprot:6677536-Alexandrium_andersonii.AAC.1
MGDARIVDVADFGAPADGNSGGPAWSEFSGGRGAGSGPQHFRDDITGAALSLELVSAACSEEIRFVESWGVWDVRPIS